MAVSGAGYWGQTTHLPPVIPTLPDLAANDNRVDAAPLFEHFGIRPIGDCQTPSLVAIEAASLVPSPMRWSSLDTRLCFGEYYYQLYLPMSSGEFNNVVQLVPPRRYPALDNHFPSLVRKDRTLSRLAVILAHRRKLRLGDVVQMSEGELLALLKGNKGALERLRGYLQAHTLDFGMRAPRWKSPGGLLGPDW
jgi:hypothetical protein